MTEGPLNRGNHVAEGGWMRGDREGLEENSFFFGRQVEQSRTAVSNVDGDNSGNFFSEGLDSD